MYLRSRSATKLFFILCNASGDQKSKMAAQKQEIFIFEPIYNVPAQLTAISIFFGSRMTMKQFSILFDASGNYTS